ncbi:class I SAM-dependent RNA methyltransferase [Nitrospirillum sp. BR 11164]|uniref:class I SAM-dependent RNA methyltransferase n=1 Tax=Nitrospirillum sp. BR 11164 TaxID=3104324 RepID=UPI002AFE27B3|nr:class I SAM-dependent RNA methyltransferase [Nitrospirillum sp. BR 11164]MEA1649788.1 class I SAM-dependent RNA methyltransferase [Nitrospirillum sp. BR 11164]
MSRRSAPGPTPTRGKPSAGGRHQPRRPGRTPAAHPPVEPPTSGPIEITVESVGALGDGVAHWQEPYGPNHRLFVPQTLVGDRLMVRFAQQRGEGWLVEPVSLLAEGPGRADPACRHFGICGGCTLQHMDADTYGAWKVEQLRHALSRAGINNLPLAASGAPLVRTPPHARRRAVLAAARRGRRLWLGFNERASHRLVDIEECAVLAPRLMALVAPLRTLLLELLPDEHTLDVALTLLDDGPDVLLVGLPQPDLNALERLGAFAEAHDLARLSWSKRPGAPAEPIALRRTGVVRFGPVAVSPAAGSFLQASAEGEAALVAEALAGAKGALSQERGGRVADLFAGSGTLTFPLSTLGPVHAVEGDGVAITALEAAARVATGAHPVTVERRDLFKEPLSPAELSAYQAVVFDPPRAGAASQAAALAASSVPVVVAISCNPVSFARDAALLLGGGYVLERLVPVDQFLWSPHLEVAARFRRP